MDHRIGISASTPVELRMGSPYLICNYTFSGTNLDLPSGNWQDKYAWSYDGHYLVLIQYDFEGNDPGWRFYIVDAFSDTLRVSERFEGLVNSVSVEEKRIIYNRFLYDAVKSQETRPKELCCHADGIYVIPA